MRTAAELGIGVPDDVSVAGFDNIPDSALANPPLTTVDQSIQAQGHEAVRTLLALIEHPELNDPQYPIHITLADRAGDPLDHRPAQHRERPAPTTGPFCKRFRIPPANTQSHQQPISIRTPLLRGNQ